MWHCSSLRSWGFSYLCFFALFLSHTNSHDSFSLSRSRLNTSERNGENTPFFWGHIIFFHGETLAKFTKVRGKQGTFHAYIYASMLQEHSHHVFMLLPACFSLHQKPNKLVDLVFLSSVRVTLVRMTTTTTAMMMMMMTLLHTTRAHTHARTHTHSRIR